MPTAIPIRTKLNFLLLLRRICSAVFFTILNHNFILNPEGWISNIKSFFYSLRTPNHIFLFGVWYTTKIYIYSLRYIVLAKIKGNVFEFGKPKLHLRGAVF